MTVPGQGQEPAPQNGQEPAGVTTTSAASPTPNGQGQEPTTAQQSPDRYDPDYVKSLRKSEAESRKKLQEAEAKVKEFEQAQLTESERMAARLKDAELKASDLESKYQGALIRAAVVNEATKQGAVDADVIYALIDRAGLELQDDGTVKGADKAVKTLLDAKPYLVANGSAGGATRSTPTTPKAGGKPDREDQIKQTQQEMRARAPIARL